MVNESRQGSTVWRATDSVHYSRPAMNRKRCHQQEAYFKQEKTLCSAFSLSLIALDELYINPIFDSFCFILLLSICLFRVHLALLAT